MSKERWVRRSNHAQVAHTQTTGSSKEWATRAEGYGSKGIGMVRAKAEMNRERNVPKTCTQV